MKCWLTPINKIDRLIDFWTKNIESYPYWLNEGSNAVPAQYDNCLDCSIVKIAWHFTMQKIRSKQ